MCEVPCQIGSIGRQRLHLEPYHGAFAYVQASPTWFLLSKVQNLVVYQILCTNGMQIKRLRLSLYMNCKRGGWIMAWDQKQLSAKKGARESNLIYLWPAYHSNIDESNTLIWHHKDTLPHIIYPYRWEITSQCFIGFSSLHIPREIFCPWIKWGKRLQHPKCLHCLPSEHLYLNQLQNRVLR